jgi:hypothetical protein
MWYAKKSKAKAEQRDKDMVNTSETLSYQLMQE